MIDDTVSDRVSCIPHHRKSVYRRLCVGGTPVQVTEDTRGLWILETETKNG